MFFITIYCYEERSELRFSLIFNWVDPDSYLEYASGFTKLLKTDPSFSYGLESKIKTSILGAFCCVLIFADLKDKVAKAKYANFYLSIWIRI